MNELYNEVKNLGKESYSIASKIYGMQYRNASIEAVIKNRKNWIKNYKEKLFQEKLKKRIEIGNKLQRETNRYLKNILLNRQSDSENNSKDNLFILLNKNKTIYNQLTSETQEEKKKEISNEVNIDNEISDIFKKIYHRKKINKKSREELEKERERLSRSETQKLRILQKRKIKDIERPYFPNFNSIYPHSPTAKIIDDNSGDKDGNEKMNNLKKTLAFENVCEKFIDEHVKSNNERNLFLKKHQKYNLNLFYSLVENQKMIPSIIPKDDYTKITIPKSQISTIYKVNSHNTTKSTFNTSNTEKRRFGKRIIGINVNPFNSTINTGKTNIFIHTLSTNNSKEKMKEFTTFNKHKYENSMFITAKNINLSET